MRVISGHLGWVRCIAVDPSNDWFATGSGDRTIKVCCVVEYCITCTKLNNMLIYHMFVCMESGNHV